MGRLDPKPCACQAPVWPGKGSQLEGEVEALETQLPAQVHETGETGPMTGFSRRQASWLNKENLPPNTREYLAGACLAACRGVASQAPHQTYGSLKLQRTGPGP